MDEPLAAHTANEAGYCIRVARCAACAGPMEAAAPMPTGAAVAGELAVEARCKRCGAARTFRFSCQFAPGADGEAINPTDEPSRIVDLGQWVALAEHYIEAAAEAGAPGEARRLGERACRCLGEALKFYGPEELPPEQAFFTAASAEAFGRSPVTFARQHLRDMQVRLPKPIGRRAGEHDAPAAAPPRARRWWEFWK